MDGWSRFFSELAEVFNSCSTQIGTANERYAIYIVEKLENALQKVEEIYERLEILDEPENELLPEEQEIISRYKRMITDLMSFISSLLSYWDVYLDEVQRNVSPFQYRAGTSQSSNPNNPGRPTFDVEKSQLEYLRSLNFTWTEIASLLGVSRMTIYRRRSEYGLLNGNDREMTTSELTGIIQQLRHDNPYSGESILMGHLRSMGVFVPRSRVRRILHRIDPLNTSLRWGSQITTRRPYSVPGPNSLWHLGIFNQWLNLCVY